LGRTPRHASVERLMVSVRPQNSIDFLRAGISPTTPRKRYRALTALR
jgi:hypothetical protein